jgi:hypothetical protein
VHGSEDSQPTGPEHSPGMLNGSIRSVDTENAPCDASGISVDSETAATSGLHAPRRVIDERMMDEVVTETLSLEASDNNATARDAESSPSGAAAASGGTTLLLYGSTRSVEQDSVSTGSSSRGTGETTALGGLDYTDTTDNSGVHVIAEGMIYDQEGMNTDLNNDNHDSDVAILVGEVVGGTAGGENVSGDDRVYGAPVIPVAQ